MTGYILFLKTISSCREHVGLKMSGLNLGKWKCLEGAYHQAQNPHTESKLECHFDLRILVWTLGKQLSPKGGIFGLGSPKLGPGTPDGLRADEQTLNDYTAKVLKEQNYPLDVGRKICGWGVLQ